MPINAKPKEKPLAMNVVEAKIDHVLAYICEHARTIQSAHRDLGLPLDECLCAAVRQALHPNRMDPVQLELSVMEKPDDE